jgi:hypothetical protein
LRALNRDLNQRIVKTIPPQAYDEVGDAIGILHDGALILDTEDMASVLKDSCLYDWFENGKNLVQRYAETHPVKPGTDEDFLLNACLRAKYRIVLVQSAVPGAGLHCRDVLNGGELFLMDVALSETLVGANAALATRTIPLGEYWMTDGAGLPINSKKAVLEALDRIATEKRKLPEGPGAVSLTIVRACLAAGAADYVVYEGADTKPARSWRQPRWPGFKRRRH